MLRCVRLALLWVAVLQATGSLAQHPAPYGSATPPPVAVLLARAAQLDANGKPDLAAQAWRQVLLADPENISALEHLARFYAQSGDRADARAILRRLRAAHPSDPELADLQRPATSKTATAAKPPFFPPTQDARLLRAEVATREGDNTEAFHIYRSVFGELPPREWAIAYYQAEAATPGGKPAAVAGLQQMARQYPSDVSLGVAWGRELILDPGTRLQGTHILARYAPSNAEAELALRESLLWGVSTPALAGDISAYLAHYSDPSLATVFARARSMRRSQAEISEAYRSLRQKDTALAEQEFRQALARNPRDGSALAGMGYVCLEQHNFSAAARWLELAAQHGNQSNGVHRALLTAHFWQGMAASQAAAANHDPQQAESQLHAALQLEPRNPVALLALAHLYADTARPAQSLTLFREIAERSGQTASSSSAAVEQNILAEAWSGWMTSSALLKNSSDALTAYRHLSADVQTQLSGSPTFLASLAQAYLANGQRNQAEESLSRAANLPATTLHRQQRAQLLLQYAALSVEDGQYDRAHATYREIVESFPDLSASSASAWQGLVLIEHLQAHDTSGLLLWKRMPPAIRSTAMQDISFVLLLAGMQQSQGDFSSANDLLQQAQAQMQKKNEPPPLALLRQSAALDLVWRRPNSAIPLCRAVLARNSNDAGAWTELLRALHQAGQDRLARDTERTMPAAVRSQLRDNSAYLPTYTETYFQTMASVEQALGNPQAALDWLRQIDAIAHSRNADLPVDMQLQEAWLQYGLHQDEAADANLQRMQQRLAGDASETSEQRNQIAELTADLAVRNAGKLIALGKRLQAIGVLDAASNMVGNRAQPRLRLAAGYLTAGAPATAVAIYQSVGMQQATVGDRKAAIGAAMESKQISLAQAWLQQGLADCPHDAGLLLLAGNFAQSNGREALATKYLRAALATGPSVHVNGTACQQDVGAMPRGQDMNAGNVHRQAEELLARIRAAHSGWIGGTGYVSHILGTSGTTQLTDVEVPIEVSLAVGERARLTAVLRTARLDSGGFYGSPGQSLGTLVSGASAASIPATGVGGSLQLATRSVAASIGSTPAGFPAVNVTAAASLHIPGNPWTLTFTRDGIRESQLSYAGLHDPAQPADVWGAAIANLGSLQYARGDSQSGWYVNASGGVVTGHHIASNAQVTGDAGAYWQLWSRGPSPGGESFNLGVNLYAQHDDHNELFFTYGHGGYFSPEYYLLPAIPLTYRANSGARLHYELSGSLGTQILSQSSAQYFPLDATLQTARGNPIYPAQFTVGVNYGAQGKVSYLRGDHWRFGAFFGASNANSYNQQIGGFSLRYMFRNQHVSKDRAAGWFPYSGLRPYLVP